MDNFWVWIQDVQCRHKTTGRHVNPVKHTEEHGHPTTNEQLIRSQSNQLCSCLVCSLVFDWIQDVCEANLNHDPDTLWHNVIFVLLNCILKHTSFVLQASPKDFTFYWCCWNLQVRHLLFSDNANVNIAVSLWGFLLFSIIWKKVCVTADCITADSQI